MAPLSHLSDAVMLAGLCGDQIVVELGVPDPHGSLVWSHTLICSLCIQGPIVRGTVVGLTLDIWRMPKYKYKYN